MMKQHDNLNPKDDALKEFIAATAGQTNPNPVFQSELEKRLIDAHKPKAGCFTLPSLKQFAPILGWAVVIVLLALGFNWMLRALSPVQMPASNDNACAVTQPNGSLPPGETVESSDYLGNGELWTALWPDGKVHMSAENQRADGSFDMKWPWWRGVTGPLTIEGRRLDAETEPLRADIPDGYGDTGFQVSALIFPSTGCWEVTGRVGNASLTFVTEVIFGEATQIPNITIDNPSPTPSTQKTDGYDFRGAKLYLGQSLPESPAQANIYLLNKDRPASADEARALADRFGIQGEMYTGTSQIPGAKDYVFTDGKQLLSVHSNYYFTYTSDIAKNNRNFNGTPNENAEAIIAKFLKSHGFDFSFQLDSNGLRGGYIVQPLSPDGIPMQYEFYSPSVMRVTLDENGEVLNMEASLMDYDPTPVGTYDIITSQEALDKLLDDNDPAGKIESFRSGTSKSPQEWYRQYPDNQIVTVYGFVASYSQVDSSKSPIIFIDNVSATGNTKGLEKLDYYTFIKASGQYFVENGIRKFNVESWSADNITQSYFPGYLDKYGGQTLLITATDDGTRVTYPITDLPPDVPLNTDPQKQQLSVIGVIVDGKMFWTYIQFFEDMTGMGGGGGGGGLGFYKLNLSGTPVPFPTPTMSPGSANNNGYAYTVVEGDTCRSIAEAFRVPAEKLIADNNLPEDCSALTIGQTLIINADIPTISRLDGARGILNITLYSNGDGTMRAEYGFITSKAPNLYLFLEGEDLQELQGYNNKPVEIWGSVTRINQYNAPVIRVEKYNIPFPELKPQIMKGTENSVELEGKNAVLFTAEDGKVYAEFMSGCNDLIPVESMAGTKGGNAVNGDKSILVEALPVPDLSFAGYPGICIFQVAPATQANGDPMELTITSDKPGMMPESPATSLKPPKLTIDQVELVYFVSNPQYQANDPTAGERSPYIQPAWHFHGQYESGEEFDAIIQALKKEFLSPELAPYIQGG